ncbi:MAG: NAD-dependent protein deacetylase [Halioglobus sp.]
MSKQLREFIHRYPRLLVITGAGVSAESGIATYRDRNAVWQASTPIQHQQFIDSIDVRQRYWARSFSGWPAVADALPNEAHFALRALESMGHVELLITQNVDRLHQLAGSTNVVDLHGRLDRVVCLQCNAKSSRHLLQAQLGASNPELRQMCGVPRPDGDFELRDTAAAQHVPKCADCGGILMPDVVFFGGTVPSTRLKRCMTALEQADGVLVVGSSLQVYSGFRFCRRAVESGIPLALVNQGRTRADDIATLKIDAPCAQVLTQTLSDPITAG